MDYEYAGREELLRELERSKHDVENVWIEPRIRTSVKTFDGR